MKSADRPQLKENLFRLFPSECSAEQIEITKVTM